MNNDDINVWEKNPKSIVTTLDDNYRKQCLKDVAKPQLPPFTSKEKYLQKLRICLFYSDFHISNTTSFSGHSVYLAFIHLSV